MQSILKRKTIKNPKNFHEILLENIQGLVFVKDQNYRLVYANKAFLDLYPPEQRDQVVGSHSADNFTAEEAKVFNAEDKKALEHGFSEIVEEISDYKGRKFMFQTQKIRYTDEQGAVRILGIGTDITKLVEREKLLAKSNVALENFAAVAAHDLRSPLAALSMSLEILKNDEASVLSARSAQHVELMTTCIEGLIDQVAQLLVTYKVDDEEESPHTMCDVSILFQEVKFNLSSHIQKADAKVLSTELPMLKVNKTMFRQLLHNLVENSLKYRALEKPIIILRHNEEGNAHFFSVEDNGVGVDPAHREKIFNFNTRLDHESEGYGIGLSLCQKVIEMHDGKIWLDEKFTDGCRICFSFPA